MSNIWQLQDAKARLSEIVRLCKNGPQIISVHGVETVVFLSKRDYDRLTAPKENLVEFMNKSPLKGLDLDLDRDKSPARNIKL